MVKNHPKTLKAWTLYDWANSVYSLCIGTAVFPIYYGSITNPEGYNNMQVAFWGLEMNNGALLSWTISASFLLVVLLSPLLSGIADYTSQKKRFMKAFVWTGALACMSLFFFTRETLWVGVLGSFFASVGFAGSLVFYNAYLPEIATNDKHDMLSAKGFSMGYWGSVLLLTVIIAAIQLNEQAAFMDTGLLTRCTFVVVGVWWLGFSYRVFPHLPDGTPRTKHKIPGESYIKAGVAELLIALKDIRAIPFTRQFLLSFFFYSMGVQTVIYVAGLYAKDILHFASSELILIILIIQLVASGGAFLFAKLSSIWGNVKTIMVQLTIWLAVCILAYTITAENKWLFYVAAAMVGLVLGGIQSLSRATYSKQLPNKGDNASYFSFYEMTEKTGIVIGTASFGIVSQLAGGMRNAILALTVFFVIAMVFLIPLLRRKKVPLASQ